MRAIASVREKESTAHHHCSACSGLIGAALGTPLDVVKTRVMNQPTDERARWVLTPPCLTSPCRSLPWLAWGWAGEEGRREARPCSCSLTRFLSVVARKCDGSFPNSHKGHGEKSSGKRQLMFVDDVL